RSDSMSTIQRYSALVFTFLLVAILLSERSAAASISFLAVGAGDAGTTDAILWTRVQDSSTTSGVSVTAQVSTDLAFATGVAPFPGMSDATQDYTLHIRATGLASGTRYFYRFVAADGTTSPVGTFVTAPDAHANAPIKFGFSGDADGQMRPYIST